MWSTLAVVLAFVAVSQGEIIPEECKNPPDVDIDDCCVDSPEILTNEIIMECGTDNKTDCEASDCVAKMGNYMLPNGKVNTTTFKTLFNEWGNVVDTLLQACTLEMGSSNVTCKSETLIECMVGALFVTCPRSMWNCTTECAAFKSYMLNC